MPTLDITSCDDRILAIALLRSLNNTLGSGGVNCDRSKISIITERAARLIEGNKSVREDCLIDGFERDFSEAGQVRILYPPSQEGTEIIDTVEMRYTHDEVLGEAKKRIKERGAKPVDLFTSEIMKTVDNITLTGAALQFILDHPNLESCSWKQGYPRRYTNTIHAVVGILKLEIGEIEKFDDWKKLEQEIRDRDREQIRRGITENDRINGYFNSLPWYQDNVA